jgi:hypothetical protein
MSAAHLLDPQTWRLVHIRPSDRSLGDAGRDSPFESAE